MLGCILVTEKGGRAISRLLSSRNTLGMVSIRPVTPRWGRAMSSQARRLRACFRAASVRSQRAAKSARVWYQRSDSSYSISNAQSMHMACIRAGETKISSSGRAR